MAKRADSACEKFFISGDYYESFSQPGGVFNKPAKAGGCLPWRFLLAGNNCRDNANFNPVQHCNTADADKPYTLFPRMIVEGHGRLGINDSCLRMTCYPGDNVRTSSRNGRSEILFRPEVKAGSSYWYAWSFRLPPGFSLDNRASCGDPDFNYTHCIITQMHTTEKEKAICGSRGAPGIPFNLNLRKEKGEYLVAVNFGAVCGEQSAVRHGRFVVVPGPWYDVVLNITWSADPGVSAMEIEFFQEGSPDAVFHKKVSGVKSFFKDEGNGFLILHMGAYVGKSLCNPVSVLFDEFSFARKRCCLKSQRIQCECD